MLSYDNDFILVFFLNEYDNGCDENLFTKPVILQSCFYIQFVN